MPSSTGNSRPHAAQTSPASRGRMSDRQHGLAHQFLLARRLIARTQRVIEDQHARRAGPLLDQLFDLRVVDVGKLLGVEKIRRLGRMINELEAVLFEFERAYERAAVANGDLVLHARARALPRHVAGAHCFVDRLLTGIDRVDQFGLDFRQIGDFHVATPLATDVFLTRYRRFIPPFRAPQKQRSTLRSD